MLCRRLQVAQFSSDDSGYTGRGPRQRHGRRVGSRRGPASNDADVSSIPLSFRTAGFPQYGWQADLSDGAVPSSDQLKPAPGMR